MLWNDVKKSMKQNKNLNKRSTRFTNGILNKDDRKLKLNLKKPSEKELQEVMKSNESYLRDEKIKQAWTVGIVIALLSLLVIMLLAGFF